MRLRRGHQSAGIQHAEDWTVAGKEFLRIMKPGRRLVMAEIVLGSPEQVWKVNSDLHIQHLFDKIFSRRGIGFADLAYYSPQALAAGLRRPCDRARRVRMARPGSLLGPQAVTRLAKARRDATKNDKNQSHPGRGSMNETLRKVVAGIGARRFLSAHAQPARPRRTTPIAASPSWSALPPADLRTPSPASSPTMSARRSARPCSWRIAAAPPRTSPRARRRAPPDGYTVLVSTTALTINATLYKKLDYALLDDLIPVAIAVRAPETLSVGPGKPQTLPNSSKTPNRRT